MLLAILCVAALTLTQLYNGEKTAAEDIETGAEELVGQMKNMYEEYGSAAVAQADEKATVDEDGAVRWKSNGRCLMDDFCEKLEYAGYPFSREATAKKRDAQNEESIAEYRRNHRGLSGEALAEARSAFGEGATVVNILTGERTKL